MRSQKKGAAGELELLHLLEARGIDAQRNDQRYIGGLDNPDLAVHIRGQPFHVEVKRREKLALYDALEQAKHDANGHALPIVAHRRNRKPWCVILTLDDFLNLLQGGEHYGA